jgi:4-hydroxy-4-methyl-2-oxoglutarate aldolase
MATAEKRIDDDLLARAAGIGTASLHEAGERAGALPATLRALHPSMHVSGRAFPVRSPVGDNLWLHRALAAAQPGDILVVDAGEGAGFGYWGEIMASAAIARGIAGIVITGGVRDSLRLIELGHPTFTTGTAIRGTVKVPDGDGAVGEPVRIGEVLVRLGDLIVGDADGVVAFPAHRAADVIAAAEQRDAAEQDILRRLAAGETTVEIYKLPAIQREDA